MLMMRSDTLFLSDEEVLASLDTYKRSKNPNKTKKHDPETPFVEKKVAVNA